MCYINICFSQPEKYILRILENLENKKDCIAITNQSTTPFGATMYIDRTPVVLEKDIQFANTKLAIGYFTDPITRTPELFTNKDSFRTVVDCGDAYESVYVLTSEGASYLLSVGFNIHFC